MKQKFQVVKSPRAMRKLAESYRLKGLRIGLVPTMGALHEGHLSLISKSDQQNDITIVSIFINPTQFGPGEDFTRYPRAFKLDCAKAKAGGANIIFHPSVKDMYPDGFQTFIDPGPIADKLEGAARPGHMRGVATICLKLFSVCQPHQAYFGQKDAQQLAVIRSIVRDFNLDLKIVRCPIVRTKTGIALSSRHAYLSAGDLKEAEVIYDSLKLAKKLIAEGETDIDRIKTEMAGLIGSVPGVKIEYISFNKWDDLADIDSIIGKTLISMVVIINNVRLLDNIIISPKT